MRVIKIVILSIPLCIVAIRMEFVLIFFSLIWLNYSLNHFWVLIHNIISYHFRVLLLFYYCTTVWPILIFVRINYFGYFLSVWKVFMHPFGCNPVTSVHSIVLPLPPLLLFRYKIYLAWPFSHNLATLGSLWFPFDWIPTHPSLYPVNNFPLNFIT